MAIVAIISNQKTGHMQIYSEGNETNYTNQAYPDDPQPPGTAILNSVCSLAPVHAGRKIQGLWLAWF